MSAETCSGLNNKFNCHVVYDPWDYDKAFIVGKSVSVAQIISAYRRLESEGKVKEVFELSDDEFNTALRYYAIFHQWIDATILVKMGGRN